MDPTDRAIKGFYCIYIYSYFMSLLHFDMTQVVEILPHVRKGPTYSTVDITAANDLMTLGARASATMMLNRINSVPAQ